MNHLYIFIIFLIFFLLFIFRKLERNELFIDNNGCTDCYKKSEAGDLFINRCANPWQKKDDRTCECKDCYDPQNYNNDVPMQSQYGEKLISYGSKICHCTPCTNSQINLRPW